MSSRRNVLVGLAGSAAAIALGGCGFRPLYGRSAAGDLGDTLARVEIGPVRATAGERSDLFRVGQQVRNALLDGLQPRGAADVPLYRLDVNISEGISSLAVQKSADATRADLTLEASFHLTDRDTGKSLFSGTSRAISSFNILNSEFATLMAERGARDKAVRQLGDDIRLKTAIFLRSHAGRE